MSRCPVFENDNPANKGDVGILCGSLLLCLFGEDRDIQRMLSMVMEFEIPRVRVIGVVDASVLLLAVFQFCEQA